jgi:hypothetical protein
MPSWSQNPLCHHAATLHPDPIFHDLFLGASQVVDKIEAENEPEQFIEKAWLTDAQKSEAEQLIENKGQRTRPDFLLKTNLSISLKTNNISEN